MNEMIGNEGEREGRSSMILHIIYAMAVIAAALVFFYFGYRTGISSSAAPVSSQQVVAEEVRNVYVVCTKNGKLCIYERSPQGESLIASERVSTEVFPLSDRERLEAGIEFETMAQAQAVFEDFVN